MIKIGQRLKTLRRLSNLTPEKVTSLLSKEFNMHFSPASIYKWEENKVEPDIYTLLALSKTYNSSISYILDDSIISVDGLSKKEFDMLKLFRNSETFMKLAILLIKYFNN